MVGSRLIALVAAAVAVISVLLGLFIWRWCCRKETAVVSSQENPIRTGDVRPAGIAKHHSYNSESKKRGNINNYYVFQRVVSSKPLFNWADYPWLITDAVENGWSRFGFTTYSSSSSTKSSFLGLCATGDSIRENNLQTSWEVSQGSADFMQKIRINSGFRVKTSGLNHSSPALAAAVIRTALPLPGPPLGNSAFPQEAYFELTILSCRGGDDEESVNRSKEGERIKLLKDKFSARVNSESSLHASSEVDELKLAVEDAGKAEDVLLSVGLTGGGSLPPKLPGSYPGSVGFNSDGSVFLEGIKLVLGSEKEDWGRTDKVIGCGFDPRQKRVCFTVDSQLVHQINCKSEAFGAPLYPTLAANGDISVLVNFGQSMFKYAPANAQRTANPCFIGRVVNSPAAAAIGYEDSRELFSMGRIDSKWFYRSSTRASSYNNGTVHVSRDLDEEAEDDLFEIVLHNNSARSSNTAHSLRDIF